MTWTEPNSDNINYYDINVKKGSNLYTSSKAVRNSFDIALEEGEYTIEVIAVLNDYSQTEPGSITFTVSQEIAEQSVLKGLTLTIDAEGLEGKGTEEEPYIIYRDNTDYYITDYDKEIKFSIAPDPETAEITGKIYYDHSSGLKYDAEKKLITGFSTSYDATLEAYTLDDSYNTIYSNKVYFRVGFAFDSVSLEQDDFNLALDSEVQKTLTPQYYKGDVELPVTPLIKAKSWTSSDETVAVVENGVVKALSAGKATITQTDSMVGWCIASNAIKLGFDVRNEATTTRYGIVRYATNEEVKETLTNSQASQTSVICPKTLNDNYLQITKPVNQNQDGSSLSNPIEVNSFVKFNQTVLGSSVSSYDVSFIKSDAAGADNSDKLDFYGCSYRAWYADLAEFYEADKYYEAGTLVTIGGIKEITIAKNECNGIVSTNPGFELGNKLSDMHLPIALVGRVPVLFDGNCMPKFGDKIYLSKVVPGRASTVQNGNCLGKIVAKNFGTNRLIECIIRIDF